MKDMFKQEIAIFSEDASLIYPLFFLSSIHNRNHKHTYTASLQKKIFQELDFFRLEWVSDVQGCTAAVANQETPRFAHQTIFLSTFEYSHL